MTHTYKPEWSDFYEEGLGPYLPLTSEQREIPVSGILPSGESALFDNRQLHDVRSEAPGFIGSGINMPFPYPNEDTAEEYAFVSGQTREQFPNQFSSDWWAASGLLKTYPHDGPVGYTDGNPAMNSSESGIFHWNSEQDPLATQPTQERTVVGWVVQDRGYKPVKFYTQDSVLKGSLFSNGEAIKQLAEENFDIFNNYIHHEHFPANIVGVGNILEIPFLSSYRQSLDIWNIYNLDN